MKKTLILAALCLGLILVAVGYSDTHYRTSIGHNAPALGITRADSLLTIDKLRGDYVLLNFWSSTDASSRQATNQYTAWLRSDPIPDLKFISINFDDSYGLFRQIIRRDSLEEEDQFYAAGDTARAIIDNYGLKQGFGTLLIDPKGKIIAHNPSEAQVRSLVHQQGSTS